MDGIARRAAALQVDVRSSHVIRTPQSPVRLLTGSYANIALKGGGSAGSGMVTGVRKLRRDALD